jgi:hypothetical protein
VSEPVVSVGGFTGMGVAITSGGTTCAGMLVAATNKIAPAVKPRRAELHRRPANIFSALSRE